MLTLKRNPLSSKLGENKAIIDCQNGDSKVTLTLLRTGKNIQVWKIQADDWGNGEKYKPSEVALTFNQSYKVNDWLTFFGGRISFSEVVVHIKCDDNVEVNRRDR